MTKQKGKGGKRRRGWHRGRGEALRAMKALRDLPDTGVEPDLALSEPEDARKGSPTRQRHRDTA